MRKALIILAILYTAVLSFTYILGALKTPHGYLYLGTVHHPNDYFYYVSLFTQGKTRWIGSDDLFTSERLPLTLVGFSSTIAGHILSVFHIPAIPAYQIVLMFYTVLFFLLAIYFLKLLFPDEKEIQFTAFILLGIANIMPGSESFWANVTEPFTRFTRVPHQMLGLICILIPMICIVKWQERIFSKLLRYILVISTVSASILLANINPVQWVLVTCTLWTVCVWYWIIHKKRRADLRIVMFLPALFTICGIPMMMYVFRLFKSLPFSQLASWENSVHIHLSFIRFIESFGSVFLIAVFGIPLFMTRITLGRMLILIYTITSVVLFLSPLSEYIHVTNIRFITAVTIFGESILAAYVLSRLPVKMDNVRRIYVWVSIAVLAFFLVPQTVSQFKSQIFFDSANVDIYLPDDAVSAYNKAQQLTKDEDIVLVTWPFDKSFPALTGKHGFMGHPLLTINSDSKIREAALFFDVKSDDRTMHTWLTQNHISYVMGFTSVTKIRKSFLKSVYQNTLLTLYKVLPY